jgi:DNA-binding response OmpR family regulator
MPKHPRQQFSDGLSLLQQNYLRRVAGYISDIRRLRELVAKGYLPARDVQQMFQVTHNLMGSGATFGFPMISSTAKALNGALKYFLEHNASEDDTEHQRIDILRKLEPFEEACVEAVSTQITGRKPRAPKNSLRLVKGNPAEKVIYLVSSSPDRHQSLIYELDLKGFSVRKIDTLQEMDGLEETIRPHALIVSTDRPGNDLAKLPAALQNNPDETFCLIVLSSRDDFVSRLAAVKAGAHLYLPSDADPAGIVEAIAQYKSGEPAPKPPSHVALLEADETIATFYAHSLRQAGLDVSVADSPEKAFDLLRSQAIDTFVAEFSQGECNTRELISLIRQLPGMQGLPVIFILSPAEFESLPPAFRNSRLNNFLIKPFGPMEFISNIFRTLDN